MVTLRKKLGRRLENTYRSLAKGFGKTTSRVAPGPGSTAERRKAASYAQKLCRFCANERARYRVLIEPLMDRVRQETTDASVVLAIHDWSTLHYGGHTRKEDRRTLTHEADIGYDLATVLITRADNGSPIAPVSVSLSTADAVLSTDPGTVADVPHIDQIHPRMTLVAAWHLAPRVVHVIDREADSVGHWRGWAKDGHWALVRGDDRVVRHGGRERKLTEIAEELKAGGGSRTQARRCIAVAR